jgi:hypothetical protein
VSAPGTSPLRHARHEADGGPISLKGKALPPTSPLRQRNQQASLSAKNEGLLRRFEDDLALRYAERTVPEYVAHVRAFLAWAEAKGLQLAGLRRQDLASYQSELFALRKRDGRPYSAGFHVNRFSALRSFFGFLTRPLLILHNPIAGLERLFKAEVDPETVSCIVLEPVQGEGGFIPMPPDYPARLLELCRKHGILYVDDEVQSGVGRTGKLWAIEHYQDCAPDLLVSGKSIGGGLPLAAVTGRAEIMDSVPAGGLGGTFGGNPLSCAAAIAVLEAVQEPGFMARGLALGDKVRSRLDALATRHASIGEVRGLGPMLAVEFVEQAPDRAKAVVEAAFDRGLLLLACGLYGNVIRLLPALTIDDDELNQGLGLLEESFAAAA